MHDRPTAGLRAWSSGFAARAWRHGHVFLLVVLVAVVLTRSATLKQPLLESHDFRQTQTAYTALLFHQNGVDLFDAELPVLGEPWRVPFEFPLFQATAAAVMSWGVSPDPAMRITGLAWFLLTAALVWALTKHVTRNLFAAGAAVVAFAFSPFALLWSRTSMIEYAATAGAIGWAYAAIRWIDSRRPLWALVALSAGSVGMLVKPTTAGVWVIPILVWALLQRGKPPDPNTASEPRLAARHGQWVWLGAILATPIILGFLWTRHADTIKAASQFTAWLTTDSLKYFNFGAPGQRSHLANWLVIANRADPLVLGRWLGIPLALAGVASGRPRAFWIAVAASGVLPIVVFFNLYVVHDYYLAAITPAAAMLVGLGAAWIHEHWRQVMPGMLSALILAGVWLGTSLLTTRAYWSQAYRDLVVADLPIVTELSQLSESHERVAVIGLDWSPVTFYYSERRGMMLKGNFISTDTAEELATRGYELFAIADPISRDLELAMAWRWIGAVGAHTYRVGDTASDISPARVLGTTDLTAFDDARQRGTVVASGPMVVTCGSPIEIPVDDRAIWIRVSSDTPPELRVIATYSPAPLPITPVIALATPPGEIVAIDCIGEGTLILWEVVAAPLVGSEG